MSGHGAGQGQLIFVIVIVGTHDENRWYRREVSRHKDIGVALAEARTQYREWYATFTPPLPVLAWLIYSTRSRRIVWHTPEFRGETHENGEITTLFE